MHRSSEVASVGTSRSRFLLTTSCRFPCIREARLSGPSCTVSSTPRRGFTPLHLRQGSFGFSVSASSIGPFPRRPSSPIGGLGRTGHYSPERPSQPYEPHYGHTATAHAQPELIDSGLAGLVIRLRSLRTCDNDVRGLVRPPQMV